MSTNETLQDAENPTSADISDCILSLSWNNGVLGAVYYDLCSMEMTIGNFLQHKNL